MDTGEGFTETILRSAVLREFYRRGTVRGPTLPRRTPARDRGGSCHFRRPNKEVKRYAVQCARVRRPRRRRPRHPQPATGGKLYQPGDGPGAAARHAALRRGPGRPGGGARWLGQLVLLRRRPKGVLRAGRRSAPAPQGAYHLPARHHLAPGTHGPAGSSGGSRRRGRGRVQSGDLLRPRLRGRVVPLRHGLLQSRPHTGWVLHVPPAPPSGPEAGDGARPHRPGAVRARGLRVGHRQPRRAGRGPLGGGHRARGAPRHRPDEGTRASKRLLHGGWTETLETQMEHETRAIADISRTADAREGIAAFTQKRAASFEGN